MRVELPEPVIDDNYFERKIIAILEIKYIIVDDIGLTIDSAESLWDAKTKQKQIVERFEKASFLTSSRIRQKSQLKIHLRITSLEEDMIWVCVLNCDEFILLEDGLEIVKNCILENKNILIAPDIIKKLWGEYKSTQAKMGGYEWI